MAIRRRVSVISRRTCIVGSPVLELSPIMNQPACQSKGHHATSAPIAGIRGILGPSPQAGGAARVGLGGLWRAGHTARRARAPWWCAGLLAALAPALAGAQNAPAPAPAAAMGQPAASPPDASGSLAAFSAVREWASAAQTPDQPPAGLIAVPAAAVTLHYLGEPIGRGVDATGDATTVWKAARLAIAEAVRKLPVAKDALEETRRKELARQMTLTVELAGTLVPLREATYDEIDDSVSPGVYGLAARSGKSLKVAFPLATVSTGTLPGQTAAALVGEVLGDPARGLRVDPEAQPAKVAARDGVTLYRFGVSQVGQIAPGDQGTFLTRGGHAVLLSDVTAANLKTMAGGLAAHLMMRQAPVEAGKPGPFAGFRGVYFPVRNRYEPETAPAAEQALIAAALAGWAGREKTDVSFRAQVSKVLAGFFAKDTRVDPTKDARAAMLALYALGEARAGGLAVPEGAGAALRLGAAKTAEDESLAGLLALALSTSPADRAQAERIADALYAPNAKGATPDLANHAPWIVLAERELGGGAVRDQAVAPLRAFREKVYSYVLGPGEAGEEGEDLVGGVVFPGSRPPLPTAQSLRVISALAMLLADPKVTPDDSFQRELIRLMPCLRFARQLCADEWAAPIYREPGRAKWGVRAALWDPRMPGEASALGLITVRETLGALDRHVR